MKFEELVKDFEEFGYVLEKALAPFSDYKYKAWRKDGYGAIIYGELEHIFKIIDRDFKYD